jgi:hypothetical protein
MIALEFIFLDRKVLWKDMRRYLVGLESPGPRQLTCAKEPGSGIIDDEAVFSCAFFT